MTALPIVGRELQVASRRKSTFWLRGVVVALALVASGMVFLGMRRAQPHETGVVLFWTVSGIAWVLCLVSGLWMTADALAEEKREGTLGLLFLTDLRAHDVVLGKLAAHLLHGGAGLAALLPMLALPLLLGGLTYGEVGRVALALGTTLLFSLALGLWISALSVNSRRAFVMTAVALALPVIIAPWIASGVLHKWDDSLVGRLLLCFSPGCAMINAADVLYRTHPLWYWGSIGLAHGMALAALVAACWWLPRRWQTAGETYREGGWRERWHRFWTGSRHWRQRFQHRALALNPYFWRVGRRRWDGWLIWFPVVVAVVWWCIGIYDEGTLWLRSDEVYITTGYLLGGFYKMWLGWGAAQALGEERRDRTLELLLTSPLTPAQMVAGQWRALARLFRGPLFFMVVFITIAALIALHEYYDLGTERWHHILIKDVGRGHFLLFPLYGLVSLLDLAALGWLGMWLSLRLARPHRAALLTFFLVMGLPWILFGAVALLWGIISQHADLQCCAPSLGNLDVFATVMLGIWLFVQAGLSVWFWFYARRRLHHYFRLVAATPVGVKPRFQEGPRP